MSGYYDVTGKWIEHEVGPYAETPAAPSASEAQPLTFTSPQPVEPTIEDHAMSIRSAFDKIMSKAVESTELAKRVAELEALCNGMEAQLHGLAADLDAEKRNHAGTVLRLQEVQTKLAQRETTVHDLIAERDSVRDALQTAQNTLGASRQDAAFWEGEFRTSEERNKHLSENVQVLNERYNNLSNGVAAFKSALNAFDQLA